VSALSCSFWDFDEAHFLSIFFLSSRNVIPLFFSWLFFWWLIRQSCIRSWLPLFAFIWHFFILSRMEATTFLSAIGFFSGWILFRPVSFRQ